MSFGFFCVKKAVADSPLPKPLPTAAGTCWYLCLKRRRRNDAFASQCEFRMKLRKTCSFGQNTYRGPVLDHLLAVQRTQMDTNRPQKLKPKLMQRRQPEKLPFIMPETTEHLWSFVERKSPAYTESIPAAKRRGYIQHTEHLASCFMTLMTGDMICL